MNRPVNILVLGYRSRLASYMAEHAEEGVTLHRPHIDVTSYESFVSYLDAKYDAVVNCAAFTDVNACERNQAKAYQVNAYGAARAALFARTIGAPLYHISTDYVFPGTAGPYSVADKPLPVQTYGVTKYLGELGVQAVSGDNPYLIIRLGWLYGLKYPDSAPMLAMQNPLATLWDDIWGTPTHAGDAAMWVLGTIYNNAANIKWLGEQRSIIHLVPAMKPTTWFDFVSREVPTVQPWQSRKADDKGFGSQPLDGRTARRPVRGGLAGPFNSMATDLSSLWRELGGKP